MVARSRIGLYGGTFDPVHLGHLAVARKVCELFEIEKVLFIPAQVAPHKVGRSVTPPLHRYAMLTLATQKDSELMVSTFELDSENPSYTVDTLEHFKLIFGESCDLFFIMGADSWAEIHTWRDWRRVLSLANHVVVSRPGHEVTPQPDLGEQIIDVRFAGAQQTTSILKNLAQHLSDDRPGKIFFTDAVMKDISATEIRQMASEGRYGELINLVPEPVADYIRKYGIYRKSNEPESHNQREVFESAK